MTNIGKVFRTKMGDASMFRITKIVLNFVGNKPSPTAWGEFIGSEIKNCPIPMERLHAEHVPILEVGNYYLTKKLEIARIRSRIGSLL